MTNSIELKAVNDILNLKFFIPSYQRGYRWAQQQVKDLLEDIWEFSQNKNSNDEFYCLQPIIVKKNNDKWELIDGQQRLTTIYIILNSLQKKKFSLEFETREKSKDFLLNLTDKIDESNIDFFHISTAQNVIKKWFSDKEDIENEHTIRDEFNIALGKYTRIIWYQINDDSDPRELFTRINLGKIPLTNAELIKALFLRRDNFNNSIDDAVRLKQLEIASEWDRIEYTLQDDEFWYFINKESNDQATRIEFIFNLMSKKPDKEDDYFTFRYFNDKFSKTTEDKIEKIWEEIKNYFLTFEEWFNDRELYHLIGYLITIGLSVKDLKIATENKTKTDFKEFLIKEIKDKVNYDIDKLDYDEYNPNKSIENILLLFNIETLLKNPSSNFRFPFNRYKGNGLSSQKWSLEHIHAQKSKGLDTTEKRKKWIEEVKGSIEVTIGLNNEIDSTEKISQEIELLLNKEVIEFDEFQALQMSIFKLFGDPELHTIDNLTLLTVNNNSSLNNSIFPVKRNKIIDLEKDGSFIPICTRNVFLKYYSKDPAHLYFWTDNDRKDYLMAIKTTLLNYLPKGELNTIASDGNN